MSQGNLLTRTKMKQELFKNLPSEIVFDILSRLPVRSVISCKCVQKSWLHLIETQEFVKSHLSKSVPGLIMREYNYPSNLYKLFDVEDEFDVENNDLNYKLVAKFSTNLGWIKGSVDGLLFLRKTDPDALSICNPVTRNYINIHYPQEFPDPYDRATWGFGSSKMTSQYKVVRIVHALMLDQVAREGQRTFEAECLVYTLGTGLWRRCAPYALFEYEVSLSTGVFVNGNLHWLVCDIVGCLRILCFDLETEHFSTLSTPVHLNEKYIYMLNLYACGDCLGLCDNTSDDQLVMWFMKEYGVEESWTKEIVISKLGMRVEECCAPAYPIKVLRNGDILIKWNGSRFMYYSSKTKTTQKVDTCHLFNGCHTNVFLHSSSFLSLNSFGLDVSSF